jgi:hypothetical protein
MVISPRWVIFSKFSLFLQLYLSPFALPEGNQITCTVDKSNNIHSLPCYLIKKAITPDEKLTDTWIIEFGDCPPSLGKIGQ